MTQPIQPNRITPASLAVRRLKQKGAKQVAVFLGAGASKTFGYPLTRDLLPQIVAALDSRSFLPRLDGDPRGQAQRNRAGLSTVLLDLLPGDGLKRDNLPLVTSLLSLLDYSLATGQFLLPGASVDSVRGARQLLERAILEVIREDEAYSPAEEARLDAFARLLSSLTRPTGSGAPAFITSNYDMAADDAACQVAGVAWAKSGYWDEDQIGRRIDFGFPWLHPETVDRLEYPRPVSPRVRLLKLHGSTNWLRCPLCDDVFINPWGSIWHQAYRQQLDVHNECHCSHTKLEAQIVSPSFVREMRGPNMLSVWKTALDVLRAADEWIIIGYSFPDEDLGVRTLFTRAYVSRDRRPHITAVQFDDTTFSRYDAFFDSSALTFVVGGLDAFVSEWHTSK